MKLKSEIKKCITTNKFIIAIVLLSILLLFPNLGTTYFWQDESETAMLSKNILQYGYPSAWDGKNLVTIQNGRDFNEQYIWTWHPWLQHYITALSFILFGISTFSARLPFVIFGILSIVLFYFLSKRISGDETITKISTVLLVSSIPFLLHTRQCRYYSLLSFATIWMLYSYLGMLQKKRSAILQFIISSMILFHSNYLVFFGTITGVLFYHVMLEYREYDGRRVKQMISGLMGVFLLTFPWCLYANIFAKAGTFHLQYYEIILNAFHAISDVNFIIPFIFWPLILYTFVKKDVKNNRYLLIWYVIICLYLFLFISLLTSLPLYNVRYIIGIIPLFYLLLAHIIKQINDKNKIFAYSILLLLIFTNIFSVGPYIILKNVNTIDFSSSKNREALLPRLIEEKSKLESPLFNYVYEITHDYDGPIEGITKYLQEHGNQNDTVLTTYARESIMFYINMKVVNMISDKSSKAYNLTLCSSDSIDWAIPRKYWGWPYKDELSLDNITKNYEKIVIDYPDIPWENRPDPMYHKYKTVKDEETVIIYKKK